MNCTEVPVILQWRENPVRHFYSIMAAGRSGIYHDKPMGEQLLDRVRHGTRAMAIGEFRYVAFAVRTTLKMCVSKLLSQSRYRSVPLHIPPGELDRYLDSKQRRLRFLRDALEARGGPWLEVRYEQLAGPSHRDTLLAILEFLGLAPAEMDSSVRQLNGKPLRDLILNHDELEKHCQNNGIPFR